jgi:predicted glycoside hydrolase/deacetylase ChbG (UPF0249 family)
MFSRTWRVPLRAELAAQIEWVIDNGVQPSHVNGHQYIELFPGLGEWIADLLPRFSIRVIRVPLERHVDSATIVSCGVRAWILAHLKHLLALRFVKLADQAEFRFPEGFFGTAHAGRITMADLSRNLRTLNTKSSIEVAVHPGAAPDMSKKDNAEDCWFDSLADRRQFEQELLCSHQLVDMLHHNGLKLGRLALLDSISR